MGISKNISYDGLNRTGGDDWDTRIDNSRLGTRRAVRHGVVSPIVTAATHTVSITDRYLIFNGTGSITVTLPAAASWPGREIFMKTIAAQTVVSNASNVKPATSDTAGTAILAGTAGVSAHLVSDGTNWIVIGSS
jgi:hypothetical protein